METRSQDTRPIRVVVLDHHELVRRGIDVCRRLASEAPHVRTMMLTVSQDEHAVVDALLAGANGFFLKGTNARELPGAVRRIAGGGSYVDPSLTNVLLGAV